MLKLGKSDDGGYPFLLVEGRVVVVDAADGAAPEHHVVLRQRPRLVREDVLHLHRSHNEPVNPHRSRSIKRKGGVETDLAEFFGDVEGAALDALGRAGVEQVRVVVDVEDLRQFGHLNRHVERQRDHHLKSTVSPVPTTVIRSSIR